MRVRDIMLDASTDCLSDADADADADANANANADANANVDPVKIARMSDTSVNFLADAKANAAAAPSNACVCLMQARIASLTPRPMLSSHSLRARERPMRAPIASPMPG